MSRRALAPLAFCFALGGCAGAPAPSRPPPARARQPMPDAEELAERVVGGLLDTMLRGGHAAYGDAALARYVSDVGRRVARHSDRPKLAWSFVVTDDRSIGAHAIPGGFVYVSKALLPFLGSEAELAAVLAHEIAHVSEKHGNELFDRLPEPCDLGARDAEDDLARDQERQADALGVDYLGRAGYDPGAMGRALAAIYRGAALACRHAPDPDACDPARADAADPHPALAARLARVALAAGGRRGEISTDRYLGAIDGLNLDGDEPTLSGNRLRVAPSAWFELPRDTKATLADGRLSAKLHEREVGIWVLYSGGFVDLLLGMLRDRHFVAREISGKSVVIAGVDSESGAGTAALVRAPPRAYLVTVSGDDLAARELLDGVLDGFRVEPRTEPAHRRLRVLRTERAIRFALEIARRCAETKLELARALNGRRDDDRVPAHTPVKCVTGR
jgi:Peptidase family M48